MTEFIALAPCIHRSVFIQFQYRGNVSVSVSWACIKFSLQYLFMYQVTVRGDGKANWCMFQFAVSVQFQYYAVKYYVVYSSIKLNYIHDLNDPDWLSSHGVFLVLHYNKVYYQNLSFYWFFNLHLKQLSNPQFASLFRRESNYYKTPHIPSLTSFLFMNNVFHTTCNWP